MGMKIAAAVLIIFTSIFTGLGVEVCNTPGCLELASFLLKSIDPTVPPCDDFYNHVCGNYIKGLNMTGRHENGVYVEITEKVDDKVKAALEVDISNEEPDWSKKVKNYYHSCLDTARLEKYSVMNLKRQLEKIGRWPLLDSNWNETDFNWLHVEEKLHMAGLPTQHFFDLYVGVNHTDGFYSIIGLDTRQHEIKNSRFLGGMDELQSYLEALVGLAVIFGADRQQAEKDMQEVLQFEINLANLTDHGEDPIDVSVTKISELQEAWPYIQWLDLTLIYMGDDLNITEDEYIGVDPPFYFEHLGELLSNTPKRVLANYMMARVLFTSGIDLTAEARNLTYAALYPGEAPPSRSKSCYYRVEDNYFTALEVLFVRKYVTPKEKEDVTKLANMIEEELIEVIGVADWISNSTKIRGINKVKNVKNVILYPEEFLNDTFLNDFYKDLNICPWNFGRNKRALQKWTDHDLAHLIHQQRWKRWDFVPNKVFQPDPYNIPFGPAIVICPSTADTILYSEDRPLYMNLGTFGFIVGHELTHLVDNRGRYFNETGNIEDWWDSVSEEEYLKKQYALANEYSTYVEEQVNMTLNGNDSIGEIIADQGGYKVARNVLDKLLQTPGSDRRLPGLEQYSPAQLFWMASSIYWCTKFDRQGDLEMLEDVHPPDDWRVKGPFRNSPQFAKDWSCPVGSFMNPENKYNVW